MCVKLGSYDIINLSFKLKQAKLRKDFLHPDLDLYSISAYYYGSS
jgi:hypothetical protein